MVNHSIAKEVNLTCELGAWVDGEKQEPVTYHFKFQKYRWWVKTEKREGISAALDSPGRGWVQRSDGWGEYLHRVAFSDGNGNIVLDYKGIGAKSGRYWGMAQLMDYVPYPHDTLHQGNCVEDD